MGARREYLQYAVADELAQDRAASKTVADTVRNSIEFLRTRIFELYILTVSVLIGSVIVVYLRWTKKPREVRWFLRLWSASFVYGARVIVGVRFRLEGLENIPDRPVIFVGNHQSYWESIAMTVLVPHINVVTKRAAMAIPVFGWGLRYAPMTPIDRDAPGQNLRRLLRQGRASIKEGRSILIYPEGGRVPPGEHRPFTRGLGPLYRHCQCEVVPFVTNAGLHWPVGFQTKRPGTVTIRFFPAVSAGADPLEFAESMETRLNTEKDKLLVDTV
ncbi:MAG: lysophospholipid acyltransferase family protein [Alphaproteobacteria bacterium]